MSEMAEDEPDIDTEVPIKPEPIINVYGTASEWLASDPILQDGQLGIEYDPLTGQAKLKAGFQGKRYSELPYVSGAGAQVRLMATSADQVQPLTEGGETLDVIPAPVDAGQVFVSLSLGGVSWRYPDPGTCRAPDLYQPKILREQIGGIAGPPDSLTEGILAVNMCGDVVGNVRPSLYIGNADNQAMLLFAENDLLIHMKVKSQVLTGGVNVADALNQSAPLTVLESELWVITWRFNVYLFAVATGTYGGVLYNPPGQSVVPNDFVLISENHAIANQPEMIAGTAPDKMVMAGAEFVAAVQAIVNAMPPT
jgi:hypothetical protein